MALEPPKEWRRPPHFLDIDRLLEQEHAAFVGSIFAQGRYAITLMHAETGERIVFNSDLPYDRIVDARGGLAPIP